jgi:cellulose biosynthesis protein BcsQ
LFIDADLRHPSASRFLGMEKLPGLVDMLSGRIEMQDGVKYKENSKFWALSAGSKTQNPADILASERMKAFISLCKQSFDVIVIDSAPIGPVIDSIVVSNLVDKVVFVVRWASTARELVQQSIHRCPDTVKSPASSSIRSMSNWRANMEDTHRRITAAAIIKNTTMGKWLVRVPSHPVRSVKYPSVRQPRSLFSSIFAPATSFIS